MSVLIETSVGDIVIDLHVNDCPTTCLNFIKLCKIKYYNFCTFHNVQKDFMAQTGDPTGTGKGGASIFSQIQGEQAPRFFKPEVHPKLKHTNKGTVSMAISSSDGEEKVGLAGSQFFLTLAENLDYLDGKYAVFGSVAEGLDVLDKINEVFCDEKGKPYRDIRIKHTIILEDPFPDPNSLEVPEHSPEPTAELVNTLRLGEDEELDPDMPPEQLERMEREREAKAQALTLEMVGDLPFAEVKPPENVLFVCKLNPVTRDEDLELIFSRFGTIASCEIIRDVKTGDSLCYGFIEFEHQKDCEEAYFKMNNVLIDDRRIHVDFSQSVSKLSKELFIADSNPSHSKINDKLELKTKYHQPHFGSSHSRRNYDMVFDSHTSSRIHGDKDRNISERSGGDERKRSSHRNGGSSRHDSQHHGDRAHDRSDRDRSHHRRRSRSRSPHRSSRR